MKNIITLAGVAVATLLSQQTLAADFTVKIDNLTHAIFFTPMLVAAHPASTHIFQSGTTASANLQAMAEGGNIADLTADMTAANADIAAANAAPTGPGLVATATFTATAAANTHLSIVGMMLPTNDGFAGLDALEIPTAPGTYTYNLNAYDAGTEANDELITGGGAPGVAGIPADPGANNGTGGTGVAATAEGFVHIHRGALGDTNATGGVSDLDSSIHRWLNPVARITVTVQ